MHDPEKRRASFAPALPSFALPNSTTRRLAMMNLAIRGIEGDLGPVYSDTFRRDLHKDLKADESPQRKPRRRFARMRRIKTPRQMPLSL